MATSDNGITVQSRSGNYSGNQDLDISASEVTGRLENSQGQMVGRRAAFKARGTQYTSVVTPYSLIVTQSGREAFISVSTTSSTTQFPAAGGQITYTGYSNQKRITLDLSSNSSPYSELGFGTSLINEETVSSKSSFSGSGYAPDGDPGNTAQYEVSFTFIIPENNSTSQPKNYWFSFDGGETKYNITQSVASSEDYTLKFGYNNVEPSANIEVSLDSDGDQIDETKTYKVIASNNLNWEINLDTN